MDVYGGLQTANCLVQRLIYYLGGFVRIRTDVYVAEREGFEPSEALPLHVISNHAPSATRSPLRCRFALKNPRPFQHINFT